MSSNRQRDSNCSEDTFGFCGTVASSKEQILLVPDSHSF